MCGHSPLDAQPQNVAFAATMLEQEALLVQRNRASTLSVKIVQTAAQTIDGLHLKRPATCE